MSEERMATLEANLRSVTDQVGRLIDQVQQKGYVPAFRCGHSHLLLPPDYLREWGRLYGIGLGPDPVSEVLDTDYSVAPPEITPAIHSIDQIMHPVYNSRAQVDFLLVSPEEFSSGLAVLAKDDGLMRRRIAIVRGKQLRNPQGRLRTMQAKWEDA